MTDGPPRNDSFDDPDPRVTDDHIRRLSGDGTTNDVVVIGVVHGHPASTYRVQAVVDAVDPAVLALELPPLAVPVFERHADDRRTPPAAGGEMSAAIQAARTDRVVGIDGPTPAFLWRLARTVREENVPRAAVGPLARGLLSVTRHTIACRLAASLGPAADRWLPVERAGSYDCDRTDDPDRQAADERAQVRRAETVSAVFGGTDAVHVRDVAREAHMADRLATLRRSDSVVAVVGRGHLDAVADRLG